MRDALRKARISKGITQEQMGNHLEISKYAYNKIELGHRGIQVEKAVKAAQFLGMKTEELFGCGEAGTYAKDSD